MQFDLHDADLYDCYLKKGKKGIKNSNYVYFSNFVPLDIVEPPEAADGSQASRGRANRTRDR